MKVVHPALALLVEAGMLVALAVWGFGLGGGAARVGAGVGAPLVLAGFWGLFLAPRARRPAPRPAALALKAAIFVGSGALLAAAGHAAWGGALAVGGVASVALEAALGPAANMFPGHQSHR